MADITLAPTDNWQAAFRDFDGYGNITLHGGQEYNAVGGITFKAPRANIRSNGPTPPKINGYWSVENTSLASINEAGFDIDATTRPAEFNVGDRITSEVVDIDGCKFKFSGNNTDRIIVPVDAI